MLTNVKPDRTERINNLLKNCEELLSSSVYTNVCLIADATDAMILPAISGDSIR